MSMDWGTSTKGKVISVNISDRTGERKHAMKSGTFQAGIGLLNDAHAGMETRQVSLLAQESIDKIRARGLEVEPGDFAENITTEGIILHELPLGTQFAVGQSVILELTQIGKVCHNRCAIYQQVGDCVMPREGVFARVIAGGEVTAGNIIQLVG